MPETEYLVEVKNFHASYNSKKVLKDLNFFVRPKECLTLLGKSGAGKTTLLRCIIGLKKPTRGEVLVEGCNVVDMSEGELTAVRKKVAYAFQNGALFDSMTVFENLSLPLIEHERLSFSVVKKRVKTELKEFELQGAEDLYPSELSGGMKKRVGIARSMMLRPKMILYDEPTISLDPYSTANLVRTILKLKRKGAASILVTHNIPVAMQISDRIALLSDGKISAIGTPETIEKDYNVLLKNFMQGVKGGSSYEKISH